MKKILAIALIALSLSGCTQPERTERVLAENGYTNVRITGYTFFGCGQGDAFHTEFVAVSPTGKTVSGVVCSGLFKGATIRFD
jgi:hypothetical protein